MTSEEMSEIILREVDRKGMASFPEMMRAVGKEAEGDLECLCRPNVVLWSAMSQAFIDALRLLLDSKTTEWTPTPMAYWLAEGQVLKLPVVTRVQKEYWRRMWLPVAMRRVEAKSAKASGAPARMPEPKANSLPRNAPVAR
jgi:hypothetical protein